MTVLVVQAHPLEASYNAALRDRVVAALEGSGRSVVTCRLAQGERPTQEQLAEATELVLVYPTWSGGPPAELLAWIHDVLDTTGALGRVGRLTAVTSCGSSLLINRVQGQWGKRYLRTTVLRRCAPGAEFRWLPLYKIDRRTGPETTAHLDTVAAALA